MMLTNQYIMIMIIIMRTKFDSISTDELRFSFSKVLTAMKKRKKLMLTYRNKPLAIISPYTVSESDIDEDDPFFSLSDFSEKMGPLDPSSLDEEIYGK